MLLKPRCQDDLFPLCIMRNVTDTLQNPCHEAKIFPLAKFVHFEPLVDWPELGRSTA
jgi:hypothetical protein